MSKTSKKTLRFTPRSPPCEDGKCKARRKPTNADDTELELNVARYGIGFDVHKHTIVTHVQAQLQNASTVEVKQHTFRNSVQGLNELTSFLKNYTPVSHYLMECTGVYHLPLVHKLREAFPERREKIVPMNPLMVHWRITDLGVKSDRADAKDMAMLSFYDSLISPSYVGSAYFYNLRDTMRSYHKAKTQLTRLKNRITRRLDSVNQKFPFDLGKEWCLQLLDFYVSSEGSLRDAYNALLKRKRSEGKSTRVLENHAIDLVDCGSIVLPDELRFLVRLDLSRFLSEDVAQSMLIKEAEAQVLKDEDLRSNYVKLLEVPGIGNATALTVLLELGDYHRFTRWQSLVKYCGVIPTVDQSGEHRSKGHVNKYTNGYLRGALSQAASSLVNRCDRSHDLGRFAYKQRHVRKLPYKKALMKVAQKLARIVYSILLDGITYDWNYEKTTRMREKRKRQLRKKKTLLKSAKVRALKRNIQDFLISNYEYMNSTSRYHLVNGCERMIRRAEHLTKERQGGENEKK